MEILLLIHCCLGDSVLPKMLGERDDTFRFVDTKQPQAGWNKEFNSPYCISLSI
jgi:hypothetical protein